MTEYRLQSTQEPLDSDRHWENRLKQVLYRASCPSPQDLGEFQLGLLESSTVDQISLHLERCFHCSQELAQLDVFLEKTEPVVHPPMVEQSKLAVWIDQLVEAISPKIAVRGKLDSEDVLESYKYEADEVEITLEVIRNPANLQQWTIEGEIDSGDDKDGLWQVELRRIDLDDPTQTQLTEIDPLEMSIDGLEAGTYTLIFSDNLARKIHIPDIQIG